MREEAERQERNRLEEERRLLQLEEAERQERNRIEEERRLLQLEEEEKQVKRERELYELTSALNDAFHDGLPIQLPFNVISKWTDDFNIERKIGAGGFGDVFRGFILFDNEQSIELVKSSQLSLNRRPVAVKRINTASLSLGDGIGANSSDQRKVRRDILSTAQREINVLGSFRNCPNLIRLIAYSLPQSDQQQMSEVCLVYELAGKGDLLNILIHRGESLLWRQRLRIMLEICRGLSYLHQCDPEQPALHRDIKSANVVLTDDGVSKIIDCGLSKYVPEHRSDGAASVFSSVGAKLGTSMYMCPGYLGNAALQFDAQCDIYSFAIVLCEILTGQGQSVDEDGDRKFEFSSVDEITPDLRAGEWPPECVDELKTLIKSCLTKRKNRVKSMLSVMQSLRHIKSKYDIISDSRLESALASENKDLREQLQQLQLEEEARARVADNEDTRECPGCLGEPYKLSEGVVCAGAGGVKHFSCNDCFSYRVRSTCDDIDLYVKHGCAVVCSECLALKPQVCTKYSDGVICKVCSNTDETAMAKFLDVRSEVTRKMEKAKAQAQEEQYKRVAEEDRLQLIMQMEEDKVKKMEAAIELHRKKISTDILETRCPHCNMVFGFWEGCYAVQHYGEVRDRNGNTHRTGCQRYFCGWCLQKCDSDGDAHRHVCNCRMNRTPGRIFGGNFDNFLEAQAQPRRERIVAYLDGLNDDNLKRAIIEKMKETEFAPVKIRF